MYCCVKRLIRPVVDEPHPIERRRVLFLLPVFSSAERGFPFFKFGERSVRPIETPPGTNGIMLYGPYESEGDMEDAVKRLGNKDFIVLETDVIGLAPPAPVRRIGKVARTKPEHAGIAGGVSQPT